MQQYLKKQLPIASCIYIGQILVGYGLGWTAPVLPKLQDPEQTPLPDVITEGDGSWIGSVLYIGTILGPHVTGYLSNIKGRKPCLLLGGILTAFSFLTLALAQNFAMIITGRIFCGLGTGIIFVVNLVYIGEIASTNIRGILLTVTGIFGTFGTLVIYTVGPFVPYSATGYLGLAISLLFIAGLFFVPESPLFFVLKDKHVEATQILYNIGRIDDINEVLNSKEDMEIQPNKQLDWKQLFTVRSNRKALCITLTLNILQQFSGVIAVIFFATSIFELANSSIEPNVATIIIGVTQIVASSITPFFVERSGRKVLLLASTALCAVSLGVLGLYFFLDHISHDSVASINWLPLVTLIIFFLSYDMGFGIIPGTFIGEMFQPNIRSIGSAVTITLGWLFGFGVATAFGYMVSAWGGYVTFWTYSGACVLAFLFTVFFVPETRGKSLTEIQDMLNK